MSGCSLPVLIKTSRKFYRILNTSQQRLIVALSVLSTCQRSLIHLVRNFSNKRSVIVISRQNHRQRHLFSRECRFIENSSLSLYLSPSFSSSILSVRFIFKPIRGQLEGIGWSNWWCSKKFMVSPWPRSSSFRTFAIDLYVYLYVTYR